MNNLLLPFATVTLATLLSVPMTQQDASHFSRTTIDVGMVVSDIEAAAEFYGKTLGFQEIKGFSVGGDFCKDAGLTDGKSLTVRVFVLGEGPSATKLKLMEVAGAEAKTSDNSYVQSQLGLSYLTVFVSDLTHAMAQLDKAGVKVLSKGPVALGAGDAAPQLVLVRDPDGNLVELIGPKL